MIYRKRPLVVEAFQFGLDVTPDWFLDLVDAGDFVPGRDHFTIRRVTFRVDRGNWVVTGPARNNITVLRPDIFEATYEPLEDPTP